MATVGGLSGKTSNGVSMYGASMNGYGGLASGLDTDSLIEGMTVGTRTKIQEMLKKKDKYQWQTDAYRSVTDPFIAFSQKYLDVTKANSPFRSSFYDKDLATPKGTNSSKITVNGAGSLLDRMKILAINKLARDARLTTGNGNADPTFGTGKIDFNNDLITSNMEGGSLDLQYGGQVFTLTITSGENLVDDQGNAFKADYTTGAGIEKALNAKMKTMEITASAPDKLGDKIKFSFTSGSNQFSFNTVNPSDTTEVKLVKGTQGALKCLGFSDANDVLLNNGAFTGGVFNGQAITEADLKNTLVFDKRFAEKSMTFSYNGITKSIKLPTEAEWKAIKDGTYTSKDQNGNTITLSGAPALADYMQKKLDSAFGSGKVKVDPNAANDGLEFGLAGSDPSATFKLQDADKGLLGDGLLFEMNYGAGNRLNMNAPLEESGLKSLGSGTWKDPNGKLYLEINGVSITGLTNSSSLSQIISAINKSDAKVKVNYSETADNFTITSTVKGAAGEIKFNTTNDGSSPATDNFAQYLFGTGTPVIAGQDSEMVVEYDGGTPLVVKRDSNSYNLDGTTFTLNDLFNDTYTGAPGQTRPDEKDVVSFTTSVDTEKITKAITEMIEDYNKISQNVHDLVSKRPDRDYGPLTDDEKDQLSEKQIEKLEDKAKEGILFNDSILRGFADKMRSVFSGVADIGTLKQMGITVGSSYKDAGKINFDPDKFKSALLEDPDKIKTLFTKPQVKDSNGDVTDPGGVTVRLKNISDGYVKWTGMPYGTLVEKAGSTYAPNSILKNSLKTLMDDIDVDVKQLKKKLQVEIDRYTRQFTSLEQLIAQMNSQSSQLSSMLGG